MSDARTTLKTIADELGEEVAALIAERLAGLRVYIPERLERIDENHFLARALGLECARRLASRFGGEALRVPTWSRRERRRREIIALARRGMLKREIAAAVGVTEGYVYLVLARARAASNNHDNC